MCVESFNYVLSQASLYVRNEYEEMDRNPLNPVVVFEDGKWELTSDFHRCEDWQYEVPLDLFCDYWFADGTDVVVTAVDIAHYVDIHDLDSGLEEIL